MRKLVRNFDLYRDVRALDEQALDLVAWPTNVSPSAAVEVGQFAHGPDGWLAVVRTSDAGWALLRRGELQKLVLVELVEVVPGERKGERHLNLRFSGGDVWTFRYRPTDSVVAPEDDPTPFVADEHFDFALHVRRLVSKSKLEQV